MCPNNIPNPSPEAPKSRSGGFLGGFGRVLRRLGILWASGGALGRVLEASWALLRPSWACFGSILGRLGSVLGASSVVLGESWGRLGGFLGRLVGILRCFERFWKTISLPRRFKLRLSILGNSFRLVFEIFFLLISTPDFQLKPSPLVFSWL